MDRLKKRLNEPLRNTLAKARSGETNSRKARDAAVATASLSPSSSSATTITRTTGPKRQRATQDDQYTQVPDDAPLSLSVASPPAMDEETYIDTELTKIQDAVSHDLQKLQRLANQQDLVQFKRQVESGIVRQRLQNLTSVFARPGRNMRTWTTRWAKNLIPKDERANPENNFNVEEYLQDNRLDADRKVCVEYLKILRKSFQGMGIAEIASVFPKRHLVSILSCTLEMDIAKARYFNFLPQSRRRGQHWYARNHVDPDSTSWYIEAWHQFVRDYEGDPTISKHIMWYFEQDAFGLQEPKYRALRELLNPQKAWWAEEPEQVQVE